jgi:hypothetical protein
VRAYARREEPLTPLDRLIELWGFSQAEAARVFGVSPQNFALWLQGGVPADQAPAVADLAAATDLLDRRFTRERIPASCVVPHPSLVDARYSRWQSL